MGASSDYILKRRFLCSSRARRRVVGQRRGEAGLSRGQSRFNFSDPPGVGAKLKRASSKAKILRVGSLRRFASKNPPVSLLSASLDPSHDTRHLPRPTPALVPPESTAKGRLFEFQQSVFWIQRRTRGRRGSAKEEIIWKMLVEGVDYARAQGVMEKGRGRLGPQDETTTE